MANEEQQQPKEEITKFTHREKIWKYMIKNELFNYPKRATYKVYHKVPNFKGATEAIDRLCELEDFKNAKIIQLSLDKHLELAQQASLKAGKEIIVPFPRLRNGLFVRVPPPVDGKLNENFRAASRQLRLMEGQSVVKIDDKLSIDLVIIGSVCVDRSGHRIGKGQGFADLEFAIAKKIGAITPDTKIVTIVHDCQVVDEQLPADLFKKHDLHVDIIITPTETIIVKDKLEKPEGIFWDLLTQRRVNSIQFLQQLKEADEKEGKEIVLKEEDPNDEESQIILKKNLARKEARSRRNYRKPKGDTIAKGGDADGKGDVVDDETKNKENTRVKRRQPRARKSEHDAPVDKEKNDKAPTSRKPSKYRPRIDYTLKLSKIRPMTRIRDVKQALSERGVRPLELTWRGQRGICFLHFGKSRGREAVQDETFSIDSVIASLQELRVRPAADGTDDNAADNDKEFIVVDLVKKPFTRIEIVNATTV